MPIISSVPALNSIVKGVGATFTLDKAELLLVPSVAADPYFSDDTNWATVQLVYQSSIGNDPEQVVFDATLPSPTGEFNVASTSRNIFNVQSILILNAQGGFIIVPRSELTVAEFDVDMTPLPPSVLWEHDFADGNIAGSTFQNQVSFVVDHLFFDQVGTEDKRYRFAVNDPQFVGGSYIFRVFFDVGATTGIPNTTSTAIGSNNYNPLTSGDVAWPLIVADGYLDFTIPVTSNVDIDLGVIYFFGTFVPVTFNVTKLQIRNV